jgi:pimeloyl-ACP methyl ester carboxylesterase
MLLVMGLNTQMVGWHADFCRTLAGRGFHVVRFDNRDVGRSTHFTDVAPPTPAQLLTRRVHPAYTLEDMADDAVGLLDHLGVDAAHVVGASMGGMIAQSIAIRHPRRVLSLASIMSTTGSRFRGQPAFRLYPVLLRRAPTEREAYVEHAVRVFRAIGSSGYRFDESDLRERAALSYDRGHDQTAAGRQIAAIIASGDRTKALAGVRVPTLVIHGKADRLVRPSGGRATARAIPGARLELIDGMGHDLPRELWPRVVDALVANAQRAGDGALPAAA